MKAFVEFGHEKCYTNPLFLTTFSDNLIKILLYCACFHFINLFRYKALTEELAWYKSGIKPISGVTKEIFIDYLVDIYFSY